MRMCPTAVRAQIHQKSIMALGKQSMSNRWVQPSAFEICTFPDKAMFGMYSGPYTQPGPEGSRQKAHGF